MSKPLRIAIIKESLYWGYFKSVDDGFVRLALSSVLKSDKYRRVLNRCPLSADSYAELATIAALGEVAENVSPLFFDSTIRASIRSESIGFNPSVAYFDSDKGTSVSDRVNVKVSAILDVCLDESVVMPSVLT